jgi:L-ribulose-5-phosphate 4-epimerase
MLANLKEKVWKANLELPKRNLVSLSFGNVSGFDPGRRLVAIKPSGVPYEKLKPQDIVLVDLEGRIVEGRLMPSTDTPTHIEIYRAFQGVGGICHAHSEFATIFAQARKPIPCLGTTHADQFNGPVPVTRQLTPTEVRGDYERNTGKIIAKRFSRIEPLHIPAVLVAGHGPFTWGKDPDEAVGTALILEQVARMAMGTLFLNRRQEALPTYILRRHHERKHGPGAYYGQKKEKEND